MLYRKFIKHQIIVQITDGFQLILGWKDKLCERLCIDQVGAVLAGPGFHLYTLDYHKNGTNCLSKISIYDEQLSGDFIQRKTKGWFAMLTSYKNQTFLCHVLWRALASL